VAFKIGANVAMPHCSLHSEKMRSSKQHQAALLGGVAPKGSLQCDFVQWPQVCSSGPTQFWAQVRELEIYDDKNLCFEALVCFPTLVLT